MKNFFDNQNLTRIAWKWKTHLLIVGIVTIIAAAVFSGPTFITPLYKSTARLYPTNLQTMSEESESEQLLEIINSQDIKWRMIDAFNLDKVYKVDRNDPHYHAYILNEFNDHVSFKKTEYETVEVTVMDEDPVRASNMCDSLITFYNQKVGHLHSLKYWEVVHIAVKFMKKINKQLDTLMVDIDGMREKYGLLDYTTQAKEVTRGYMKELSDNKENTAGGRKIESLIHNLESKGGEYQLKAAMMSTLVHQRDSLKKIYDNSYADATKHITYSHRVQNPIPADKKAYPVRWLILLLSLVATEFLAILTILIIEGVKSTKQ
ncbi:MAG TPA: hypothetical protein VKA27_05115 [Sunxiuqinia sp.]|nr:hypothetical protein [Sunxiuqinia sp.]